MQFEFGANTIDDAGRDGFHLLHISRDQGVLADQINESWNSPRVVMDKLHGIGGQDRLGGAGDAQSLGDVCFGLIAGQGARFAPHGNALAKLANAWVAQLVFQLRLAGKDDLKELLRVGFEIGQQANLFKKLPGEILRFVDNNDA